MSEQSVYRIIRGSIRIPRVKGDPVMAGRRGLIKQGELLPQGIFDTVDIRSWLNEGRIELAEVTVSQAEEIAEVAKIRAANPFHVDPSILVSKTREELVIMVLEIDPEYDTDVLEDERACVCLLTSGWSPDMRQTVAPVNDRSRPKALALHAMEQKKGGGSVTSSSTTEMSAEAQAGLDAARAAAQAPAADSDAPAPLVAPAPLQAPTE